MPKESPAKKLVKKTAKKKAAPATTRLRQTAKNKSGAPAKKTTTRKSTKAKTVSGKTQAASRSKQTSTAKKSTSAARAATQQTNKRSTSDTHKHTSNTVVLPSRMSIRAKEKSLVWATEFEKAMRKPMYGLSMTFGALFIMFGSYAGLHYSTVSNLCQGAACAGVVAGSESEEEVAEIEDSPTPVIDLISDIPSEISQDQEVIIDTAHTERIIPKLYYVDVFGDDKEQTISSESDTDGRFAILIPGSDLATNQYTLKVQPYDAQGESYGYTTLGSFSVANGSEVVSVSQSSRSSSQSTSQSSSQSTSESSSVLDQTLETTSEIVSTIESATGIGGTQTIISESSTTTEAVTTNDGTQSTTTVQDSTTIDGETTSSETSIIQNNGVISVTESVVEAGVETVIENEVVEEVAEPLEPIHEITVSVPSPISGLGRVSISASKPQYLSVYIRRLQGTDEQLVGRLYGRNVTYNLASRNYPNGLYELYVRGSQGDDVVSNSVEIQINNQTEPIEPVAEQSANQEQPERETLRITPDFFNTPDPIAEQTAPSQTESESSANTVDQPEIAEATPATVIEDPVRKKTREKLQTDSQILDDLFTRYAAAVQSEDTDMIREARQAIANYQQSIVAAALNDEEDRFIADDLSKSLDAEIADITRKVETFENLRRERSAGTAGEDTDGDGISDTDERVLFSTDPLRADTDGDGFTDGAEIIRGFDPLNDASEASIVYRSPKDTVGIVANENLKVTEVVPEIAAPEVLDEQAVVQATVRGQALPNSFVTLYIFSTPTVVTVRTEADGSFEYTFSKELEDGEHQVFVALTDNTGDIVAQSEPFTFVKQAEAFTAVDAQTVVSSDDATLQPATSTFQTVLSMSVLALGILLIMLGVGLRSNRPDTIVTEATV